MTIETKYGIKDRCWYKRKDKWYYVEITGVHYSSYYGPVGHDIHTYLYYDILFLAVTGTPEDVDKDYTTCVPESLLFDNKE